MKDKNKFKRTRKVIVFFFDIIIYHLSFVLSFLIRYEFSLPTFNYRAYQNMLPYIMLIFGILNILSGIYVLYNKRKLDLLYSTVINQMLMMVIVTALVFFSHWLAFPRSVILISTIISMLLLGISRMAVHKLYEKVSGQERVMLVGMEENCKRAIRNFEGSKNDIYKITSVVYGNYLRNVEKNLHNIDVVYLTENIPSEERKMILSLLTKEEKQIFVSSQFENLSLLNAKTMNIEDETFLELTEFSISPELDMIKRFIDISISIILLIITFPIMLITAILVKLTSQGPIFYKQVRITEGQKEFNILKFRSMSATAEKDTGPVLAAANDMRVTPLGKYLRSLRIDELPQLINVLRGDMSLVGPRPERPHFVRQFERENAHYYLRHNVRAGITGYAQVNGKYATDFNSKLNFDLLYIKQYSIILDIQILLQTIKTLFDKVSSQGVDEEINLDKYVIPSNIKIHR